MNFLRLGGSTALVSACLFFLVASQAGAQYPGIQGTVEREIHVLEQRKHYAASLVDQANSAIAKKDYESAFRDFKGAVDVLPLGGTASADVRQQALEGFCNAAVLLARLRISEGRYADARSAVDVVLQEQYDPNYGPALSLRARLADPQGFVDRGTMTPQQVARVEEVKKLIEEAEGFFATGRYDLAFVRCEQALNIDKYNIAARRLMEQINSAREQYAEAAYNETRSDMLMQVAKGWELPVPKFSEGPSTIIEQPEIAIRGSANLNSKLESIIIPRINFTDSSIREALDFLKRRSIDLDETEADPNLKGVNIVLKVPPGSPEENAQITLEIENVPLRAALDYVAQAAGLKVKVDPYAVVIVPASENTDILITKEYKVPPNFIQSVPGGSGAPSAGLGAGSQSAIAGRSGARDYLESQGVQFPEGASANYVPSTSRLIVKNTQANLGIIDTLVETAIATPPTQIEIESRFLEVNQNNLNELGFDWLLGQFSLAGGSGIYGGGGTQGFGRTINNSAYPQIGANNLPYGATSATSGPVTAGNRGGSGGQYGTAVSVNAVDALLLGATGLSGAAPGILSFAGVMSDPQFQLVIRALSQQKGIDLVSAPKVTTQSGKRATIEIVREFRYVSEFDPPTTATSAGNILTPVAPATPNSFDTKNIGITLEVEPTVAADNYTIELRLEPRVIEFDGFINYGSPIFSPVTVNNPFNQVINVVTQTIGQVAGTQGVSLAPTISGNVKVTDNVINKPVFSTRELSTLLSVYDGQTVVMGGLMREDVQKVQDKVPILGDIPLAGRLFRSNVDQRIKKNLLIFVTASLLDPAGQPLIKSATEEDVLVPDAEAITAEAIIGDPSTIPLAQ